MNVTHVVLSLDTGGDLEYPHRFRAAVKKFEVRNRNYKWKEELSKAQQAMLEDCLRDQLVRHGYK
jgi:hypothetical protein